MRKKEEYNYFDEFVENSNYIVKSAEILKETIENYNEENLRINVEDVHKLENEADQRLHNMRNYLIKDFLPPIEREDIILIGHRLDDIEDFIDELLINFYIFDISKIREDVLEFTNLLIQCCEKVREALTYFKNFKKIEIIKEKIIEVNNLEEQGDRLFEKSMRKLYTEEKDSIEIIKWTAIYNCLENTIDACEKIGDEIEDVIMKNS